MITINALWIAWIALAFFVAGGLIVEECHNDEKAEIKRLKRRVKLLKEKLEDSEAV